MSSYFTFLNAKNGGASFVNNFYWNSSEESAHLVRGIGFVDGTDFFKLRLNVHSQRIIQAF
jgi:hypothetical protein